MTEKRIKEILEERYKEAQDKYGKNRLLGIFAYGKINYGFAKTIDDLKTLIIYIPTFEEMCIELTPIKECNEGHTNCVIDIRTIYNKTVHQDSISIETLFTDHFIMNPKYHQLCIKYFKQNREEICKCNIQERAIAAVNRAISALENNDLFEASRLLMVLDLYEAGVPCADCFMIKKDYQKAYLEAILNGKYEPDKDKLLDDLKIHLSNAKNLPGLNEATDQILRTGLMVLIRAAALDSLGEKAFIDSLTETEKTAFKKIIEKANGKEATVSTVKLIEETGISRPVYTNLFAKIKNSGIAEVTNMGVKGTHIEFLDIDILKTDF